MPPPTTQLTKTGTWWRLARTIPPTRRSSPTWIQGEQDRQDRRREPRLQREFHDERAVQGFLRLRAGGLGAGREHLQRDAAVGVWHRTRGPDLRSVGEARGELHGVAGPDALPVQYREKVERLLRGSLQRHQPDRLLRRERDVREDQGAERQLHLLPEPGAEARTRDQQPAGGGNRAQPVHLHE